ncbi:inter-alpha-trypsin inhibitor heavy chain H3-like isoform X2 [Girardinichthys multiradiatus]|uniref:inter-alpha-trypsin inhibitor heavy chain H3-like isoform X2 n=1 Tax=Girardinichthys multiradiatus TaxID=208333 RepID=UPI001FADDD20|nr:inter-alpha-trypsin inhibitor heavy chain H3-like isoform X2 [Girardinichthys multiradiatus]
MERAVVRLTLFGLLVSLATSQPKKEDRDIYSFHINSIVTSRYATTIITSRVVNRMDESKEIEFHVQIPKNAFISKFTMLIDGQVYDGVVKTKEQAQQQYTAAVSRGQSAGIVSSVGRTMEEFKTSVTVAAHKKVTFELTYEELLKRTLGKYELQIHARPMQPVKDFKVDVYIHEKAGISFIDVKGGLSTKALANAITKTHADKQAWVYFYPTEDQQKTCDSCGEQGMNGDLVIVYDVNRNNGLGDIKTSDGYFVHHFAPSSLLRIPKNVVFIIDQSGSMQGRKMQQTRTALIHILNDLAEDDFFGLLSFNSNIFHWKRELLQATSLNLEGAKKFTQNIIESGATDINAAVLEGARMLNTHPREGSASILILLTDGDPTSGETNLENIHSNVRQAIAGKFPLYCLGFGFDVNFAFLEKMSLWNSGIARRIYDDSDADLQLKGFYEEVATPLLTDVEMIYGGGTNLTQTNFSQYYNGSEIVVAGEIIDNNIETFRPQVLAISRKRKVTFVNTHGSVDSSAGTVADGLLQRVWAYLTVKQLLEKELLVSGPEKEKVKSETLELSLKYSFVTPLTSMVVTKPQGENTDVLHKPKEGEGAGDVGLSGRAGFPGFHGWSPLLNPLGFPAVPTLGLRDVGLSGRAGFPGFHGWSPLHSNPRPFPAFPALSLDEESDLVYAAQVPKRFNVDDTFETSVPVPVPVPVSHRFLLKTENQSPPLCFDVDGVVIFKLLHYPSKELYINGELDLVTNGGFTKIVIHVSADQRVEIDTEGINLHQGQSTTSHIEQDPITAGSLTVIRRDKEIDVAVEDVRLVILVHEKDGNKFLWPALRLKPSAHNLEGLLALKPADYQEVQQQSDTKLKIKDREISVSSSTADDYSNPNPVPIRCWLTSVDFALERTLNDYFVAQL